MKKFNVFKKYFINITLCIVVMFSVCLTDASTPDKIFICVLFGFIALFWVAALHDQQELQKQLKEMGYPEDHMMEENNS